MRRIIKRDPVRLKVFKKYIKNFNIRFYHIFTVQTIKLGFGFNVQCQQNTTFMILKLRVFTINIYIKILNTFK